MDEGGRKPRVVVVLKSEKSLSFNERAKLLQLTKIT